jgi:hypothetical protein
MRSRVKRKTWRELCWEHERAWKYCGGEQLKEDLDSKNHMADENLSDIGVGTRFQNHSMCTTDAIEDRLVHR